MRSGTDGVFEPFDGHSRDLPLLRCPAFRVVDIGHMALALIRINQFAH
jgi:hypothetical protein